MKYTHYPVAVLTFALGVGSVSLVDYVQTKYIATPVLSQRAEFDTHAFSRTDQSADFSIEFDEEYDEQSGCLGKICKYPHCQPVRYEAAER